MGRPRARRPSRDRDQRWRVLQRRTPRTRSRTRRASRTSSQIYLLSVIGFSLTYTYGKLVGNKKQGYVLLAVMVTIWLIVAGLGTLFEVNGNPKLDALKVNQQVDRRPNRAATSRARRSGSARRRPRSSRARPPARRTARSNSMHDSYTPLGGMMPLLHMKFGEVSPGGVGVGMNGMLVLALLAVFIAGLMVGRTPEYLGKKIQASEVKLVVIYILAMPVAVLVGAGIAIVTPSRAQRVDLQPRSARVHRGALRVHLGREQQRLGVRRDHREHAVHEHRARHRDADRSLLPDHPDAGASPARSPARTRCRRRPARSPPTRRSSRACCSASSIVVAGLTFFPALALGPIVEQLGI